jgi:ATP-binding cassette subfamily B protein AbcA/BmrA
MRLLDYQTYHTGDLIERINISAQSVQTGVNLKTRQLLETVLQLLFTFAYLSFLDLRLTLGCFAIAIGCPLVTNLISKSLRKVFMEEYKCTAEINSYLQDVVKGAEVVKTYGLEERLLQKYTSMYQNLMKWIRKEISYMMLLIRSKFLAIMGGMLFIYGYGGTLAIQGQIDVGSIIAFTFLFLQIAQPIGQLINLWPELQSSMAHGKRVFEVLDQPEEVAATGLQPVKVKDQPIHLQNLRFQYGETDVLSDVSVTIQPGEITLLMAPSGGGKSTLLQLLMQNYQPTGGTIRCGERLIQEIPLADWRRQIAFLTQEPYLFSGSIYDNIAMGREEATAEEIYAAAKAANIHEFIITLPDGYATQLGEGKKNVSTGQKQRIAIARAFLRDPEILILDEPYASLDKETIQQVQQALERLMEGKTVIATSHNTEWIRHAAKMIYLEDGIAREAIPGAESIVDQGGKG